MVVGYIRKGTRKHKVVVSPRLAAADNALQDMLNWCNSMVGKQGDGWRYGWDSTSNNFHFNRQQDAMMFMMRWGTE
jgi:hypothetical protein